jgi:signal transduction histidine kinase/ActR/RegA family two-component response regulator
MKVLTARTSVDSSEIDSELEEFPTRRRGRFARSKRASQIQFQEGQRFATSLEAAEQEAWSINISWRSDGADPKLRRSNISSADGARDAIRHPSVEDANGASGIEYSYDTRSVNEEIASNASEVQRFNKQLEVAEEEAKFINEEWGLVEEAPNSMQALDLITSIVEVVREPLLVLDNELRVLTANQAFYRTFEQAEDETEGRYIYDLARGSWNIPALRTLLDKVLLNNRAYEEVELEFTSPPSARKTLRLNARHISGEEMILISIRDVTPRRRTEVELNRVRDELRQGQKMEVVGRLAGGVAHDFNNILTAILGFSELLLNSTTEGTEVFHHAFEIKKASERAAALTQQLLAFSRRQVLRPQGVSLNAVILGMNEMLRRLIGDNIELNSVTDAELGFIHADPGQMSQVILNLAINARDAMPEGGRLTIRTENTCISEAREGNRGLDPGDYVSLIIIDSGAGMDDETQQHIFEPFYTTKPQGSGTGLGLATVFGIVEQSNGKIHFSSILGCGTTFWIDFPRVAGAALAEAPAQRTEILSGTETILLVEDDEMVRELVALILQQRGYTVLQVGKASQALSLCESYSSPIHMILTDLLMPGGMDGRQLADQVTDIRQGIKVLLMSGYTSDALVHYGVAEGAPFLQKPFSHQQLSSTIREVFDKGLSSSNAN